MGFENKAFIIGLNLRDIEYPRSSQSILADVVLIDRSDTFLQPLLYQYKGTTYRIEANAFNLVGEVLSIDKKKRQILLKDNITVIYKYLILASGLRQTALGSVHNEELAAGFNALNEAIRMRTPVTDALNSKDLKQSAKLHLSIAQHDESSVIKLLKTLQISAIPGPIESTLSGNDRRLYEVQL